MGRVARFSCECFTAMAGIRQGIRTRALLCTFMLWVNGEGEFSRVDNFLCKKTFCSGIELFCEFPIQCLIITKTCLVSYCLYLFDEFAKVFERQVWRVWVAHLHSAVRALSSPSQCFQLYVNKSWQRFASLSFALRCYGNFHQLHKATSIMCVSFT